MLKSLEVSSFSYSGNKRTTNLVYCISFSNLVYSISFSNLVYCISFSNLVYCISFSNLVYCISFSNLVDCISFSNLVYCISFTSPSIYNHCSCLCFLLCYFQTGYLVSSIFSCIVCEKRPKCNTGKQMRSYACRVGVSSPLPHGPRRHLVGLHPPGGASCLRHSPSLSSVRAFGSCLKTDQHSIFVIIRKIKNWYTYVGYRKLMIFYTLWSNIFNIGIIIIIIDNKIKNSISDTESKLYILWAVQGLLYHRTCKPDFLCSWPSLNSYLE